MTYGHRATLEQAAKEWVDVNGLGHHPYSNEMVGSLANLLAVQRAEALEEAYQFVMDYHMTKMTTTAKPALRAVTDIEDWLRQQAKEWRA